MGAGVDGLSGAAPARGDGDLPDTAGGARGDVVMVLENCGYPLDARVRMEAESLVAEGLSVEVLAPRGRGEPAREVVCGVRVRRLPLPDGRGGLAGTAVEYLLAALVFTAAVLPRLARRREGTLHVHNPPDLFFPLLYLARLRGWTTVYDHHDDAAGLLRAKLGRWTPAERLLKWMRDRSAKAADLTITTNETQRELVRPAARRVIVVRNSPPVWFADHRPTPPSGRVRLVFLGEIGFQDRVERAVDILAGLLSGGPVDAALEKNGRIDEALEKDGRVDAAPGKGRRLDAELLIVGDGPRREAVEERARAAGLRERVTITGWVPFEEVPALLASAHVGLDTAPPTEVNHGSTMVKILEYLAVGLPVVASALHETVVTGGDAVTAIEEDSVEAFVGPLTELLSSAEVWRASAARARARGAGLLWPAQRERLLEGYRGPAAR